MKSLLVFVVFVLSSISVDSMLVESRECTEWEEHKDSEAHCEPTCDFPEGITPCPAWQNATSGCVCNSGLVRGYKSFKCIEPSKCEEDAEQWQPYCNPEFLRYEPLNAHCEANCAYKEGVQPCPERFVAGCVCLEGFVRNLDATGLQCIEPDECDQIWDE